LDSLATGCGFLDPYTECLEFHIIPHNPFAASILAPPIRIDCDAIGCPVMVTAYLGGATEVVVPQQIDFVGTQESIRFLDCPSRLAGAPTLVGLSTSELIVDYGIERQHVTIASVAGLTWGLAEGGLLVNIRMRIDCIDPFDRNRRRWRSWMWERARRDAWTACRVPLSDRLSPVPAGEEAT
jgi:hypothetical protein